LNESAKEQRFSPVAANPGMASAGRRECPRPVRSLDAKGLACPLPVLKAKVILNRLQPGETLLVEATDPHAPVDFGAYCARSGHELLHTETSTSGILRFYIRRAANAA